MLINRFFSPEHTLAANIFNNLTYPHEILPKIKEFIYELGQTLSKEKFYTPAEGIWIAVDAKIAESAHISAPCIIDEGAEIRHGAFIRGSAIIGKYAVVGNSTELKNCLLFDKVQVPHYNYVGDSVLGYKAHLGAGAITSNVKSDKSAVEISYGLARMQTNMKKLGAIIGDCVEVGCGTVLNPGTVIGNNSNIYPLSSVRGFIPENCIYKANGIVTEKESR